MPELPEVEVVKRGLLKHLPGKTVVGFYCDGKKLRLPVPVERIEQLLVGAQIVDVSRRAKYLLIHFANGAIMILHLGMTGTLGLFPKTSKGEVHDHICWNLDNGYELRFNDSRRFGSVRVIDPEEVTVLEQTVFNTSGPEPFSTTFSGLYLYKKANNKVQPVKSFIMDSRIVAGVGNIYANESLFNASIRPARKAGAISEKRYDLLAEEIRNVLTKAIEYGGSTISDFISAGGDSGYFQVHFNVYGKRGQPCPHCSNPIKHQKIGGRASYFCPRCQR